MKRVIADFVVAELGEGKHRYRNLDLELRLQGTLG